MFIPRQNFAQKLHKTTPVVYNDTKTKIIANIIDMIAPDCVCNIVKNQNLIDVRYMAIINDNNDAAIIINDWALCMLMKLALSILCPGNRRKDIIADTIVDMLINIPTIVIVKEVSGKINPAIIVTNTINKNDVMVKNIGVPSNHERRVIVCSPCNFLSGLFYHNFTR